MGTGSLDTSAQEVRPAINELHTQVDSNTDRVVDLEFRAGQNDQTNNTQNGRLDDLETFQTQNTILDGQQDTRLDGLENRVDMDTVFQTTANKVVPAINELKGRADSVLSFAFGQHKQSTC